MTKKKSKIPVLEVINLNCYYKSKENYLHVLKNISFKVFEGEIIGIIGESGSGKSTLAQVLLGIIPFVSGTIKISGREISKDFLKKAKNKRWYIKQIQMIFQDPVSSLNSVNTINKSILEGLINLEKSKLIDKIEEKYLLKEKASLDRINSIIQKSRYYWIFKYRIKINYLKQRNKLIEEIANLQKKKIEFPLDFSSFKNRRNISRQIFKEFKDYSSLIDFRREYSKIDQKRNSRYYNFLENQLFKLKSENNRIFKSGNDFADKKTFVKWIDLSNPKSRTNIFINDFLEIKDIFEKEDETFQKIRDFVKSDKIFSYSTIQENLLLIDTMFQKLIKEYPDNSKLINFKSKWESKLVSIENWNFERLEITNFYLEVIGGIFTDLNKRHDNIRDDIREAKSTLKELESTKINPNLLEGLSLSDQIEVIKEYLQNASNVFLEISKDLNNLKNFFITNSLEGSNLFFESVTYSLNKWKNLENFIISKTQEHIITILKTNRRGLKGKFKTKLQYSKDEIKHILDVDESKFTKDELSLMLEKQEQLKKIEIKYLYDIKHIKNYHLMNLFASVILFHYLKSRWVKNINQKIAIFFRTLLPIKLNKEVDEKIKKNLEYVGLSEQHLDKYPSQFSGGQLQRVSIMRSLLMDSPILLADEITSALDVSIQAQILNLIKDINDKTKQSIVFISHDLNVIQKISNRIYVIKKGRIVESGTSKSLFNNPKHSYTSALINSNFNIQQTKWVEKTFLDDHKDYRDHFFYWPIRIRENNFHSYFLSKREFDESS